MSAKKIEVSQTPTFKRKLKKLDKASRLTIKDEIEVIIKNPELGVLKKGDLAYLRVHKFYVNKLQILLGYSWVEEKLQLHLLNFGGHENFYQSMKNQRTSDLNHIKDD